MTGNPYKQYQQQSIMTMTQGELVIKLFDECLKRLNVGVIYIEEKNIEKANESLQKAHKILNYLDASLDKKYEISQNLHALYDYFIRVIIKANVRKDVEPLNEIIPMIGDLKSSFQQAEKIVHMK